VFFVISKFPFLFWNSFIAILNMASSNKQQKMIDKTSGLKKKINGCNLWTRRTFKGDWDAQPRKRASDFHNFEK
jgi:hypothetical protein